MILSFYLDLQMNLREGMQVSFGKLLMISTHITLQVEARLKRKKSRLKKILIFRHNLLSKK